MSFSSSPRLSTCGLLGVCLTLLSSCWYKDLIFHERYLSGQLNPGKTRLDGYYYNIEPPRWIKHDQLGFYRWPGHVGICFFYGDGTLYHVGLQFRQTMDSIDLDLRRFLDNENARTAIKESIVDHGFYDMHGDSIVLNYYYTVMNGKPIATLRSGVMVSDTAVVFHDTRRIVVAKGLMGSKVSTWVELNRYSFRHSDWKPDSIGGLQLDRSFTRKATKS